MLLATMRTGAHARLLSLVGLGGGGMVASSGDWVVGCVASVRGGWERVGSARMTTLTDWGGVDMLDILLVEGP